MSGASNNANSLYPNSFHADAAMQLGTSRMPLHPNNSNADTPSINLQMASCHKLAVLARQKRDHARNVIWLSKSPQGRVRFQLGEILFAPTLPESWCGDNACVNSVDANAKLTKFLGSCQRYAAQSEA